ncbi:unnamed protein product [Haemonchus placei]|uniref:ANK_REP_REGION domain-containing protein n=1 Tax=Haemonchus placei TaxID=6290 RepID=A0A158QRQ8_HAEPC|nr:unnamed protein product [Haemonchus placei]
MSSGQDKGTCLVARAIPPKIANSAIMDISDKVPQIISNPVIIQRFISQVANNINPSDFVALQSIRSSALARKTATTSKFCGGRPSLFEDLLNKDYVSTFYIFLVQLEFTHLLVSLHPYQDILKGKLDADSEQNKEEKSCDENGQKMDKGKLLPRGPVKNARFSHGDRPYTIGQYCSSSSPPDSVGIGQCYRSNSPDQKSLQKNFTELSRLLDSSQLPDPLVDFILEYSRRYTEQKTPKRRPPSVDSSSPLSARSASHASPEIPTGSSSGSATPPFSQVHPGPRKGSDRTAKHCLRALIPDDEMDDAWLAPDTLTYQDDDYDTLLHIVISHHDLAKIYSLVEQQLKLDTIKERTSFDVPNRYNETPLFLAVQQNLKESCSRCNCSWLHTCLKLILCAGQKLRINELNGRGLTALHCAIINHGVISEHSMNVIDSRSIIITLLKAGADPTLTVRPGLQILSRNFCFVKSICLPHYI